MTPFILYEDKLLVIVNYTHSYFLVINGLTAKLASTNYANRD